jgi:hypothetical protein
MDAEELLARLLAKNAGEELELDCAGEWVPEG